MDMTSVAHLKVELLDALDARLGEKGLRRRRRRSNTFTTKIPLGEGMLDVMFIRLRGLDAWQVGVHICVRVDAVEEVLDPTREGATLGIDIGYWEGSKARRWTLETSDDAKDIARDVDQAIATTVLPFFERFPDLQAVLDVLTTHRRASLLCPLPTHCALTIVALTGLLGHDVEAATRAQRARLSEISPLSLPQFDARLELVRSRLP